MERKISLKAGRGWRRVLLLFVLSWLGLVAANAIIYPHGGIKGAFFERRGHAELPLASEAAIANAINSQREDASGRCLPGTMRTMRAEAMTRPIQLWEPPGEPPVDPYGGRPVLTTIIESECVSYELVAAHGFWSAVILLAIGLIALIGGWLARGFTRNAA